MMGTCHCRDCQRSSGSAFATLMIFKKETVAVSVEGIAHYKQPGGSGHSVERCFCSQCGSPVSASYDVTPDFSVIFAGTLDDPSLVKPQWNIYTAAKQPWLELPPHVNSFAGGYRRN